MAVFICTPIFKINRMHTCILVACIYIYVWEGGGYGVGWGGVVMWVCKRDIDIRVCVSLDSCIFLSVSKLTCIF